MSRSKSTGAPGAGNAEAPSASKKIAKTKRNMVEQSERSPQHPPALAARLVRTPRRTVSSTQRTSGGKGCSWKRNYQSIRATDTESTGGRLSATKDHDSPSSRVAKILPV